MLNCSKEHIKPWLIGVGGETMSDDAGAGLGLMFLLWWCSCTAGAKAQKVSIQVLVTQTHSHIKKLSLFKYVLRLSISDKGFEETKT